MGWAGAERLSQAGEEGVVVAMENSCLGRQNLTSTQTLP